MVWSCISHFGCGPLVVIDGTMNGSKYCATLRNNLPQTIENWYGGGDSGCIFQQDNAPCHRSIVARNFFVEKNIEVMKWPPYSPDLSPIENIWAILKEKLHVHAIDSKPQLIAKIRDIWGNDLDVARDCAAVIDSMPARIEACIRSKGGPTKY
jgi:hypothetical protein